MIGNSVVGTGSILDGRCGIRIGDNVCLSNQVNIWTMQHDINDISFGVKTGVVTVSDYAWISSKATILPGRSINQGAVIANSAVVTKDADSFAIYAGVPAQKIGDRNVDIGYRLNGHWWFM